MSSFYIDPFIFRSSSDIPALSGLDGWSVFFLFPLDSSCIDSVFDDNKYRWCCPRFPGVRSVSHFVQFVCDLAGSHPFLWIGVGVPVEYHLYDWGLLWIRDQVSSFFILGGVVTVRWPGAYIVSFLVRASPSALEGAVDEF